MHPKGVEPLILAACGLKPHAYTISATDAYAEVSSQEPETPLPRSFYLFLLLNPRANMFTLHNLGRKKTYSYLRKEEKFHCTFVKPVLACREWTAIPLIAGLQSKSRWLLFQKEILLILAYSVI